MRRSTSPTVLLAQTCPPKPGFLARVAARIGLEVTARATTSCTVDAGICVGCPTDYNPGGVLLDYGYCTGVCGTGSTGYTQVSYDPGGSRGWEFTGNTDCKEIEGCPCALSYCSECTIDPLTRTKARRARY